MAKTWTDELTEKMLAEIEGLTDEELAGTERAGIEAWQGDEDADGTALAVMVLLREERVRRNRERGRKPD